MTNLVIVESPTKIAPIKKYLGANYKIILNINAERAFGQVSDVSLGGNDFIVCAEIFLDRCNFGW